jgi:hypothetical protein
MSQRPPSPRTPFPFLVLFNLSQFAQKHFCKYLLHSELALLYFTLRLTYLGTDSITCGTDN